MRRSGRELGDRGLDLDAVLGPVPGRLHPESAGHAVPAVLGA